MTMRAYIFVDAENHFLRSVKVAERVIGSPDAAKALGIAKLTRRKVGFPRTGGPFKFLYDQDLHFFWDKDVCDESGVPSHIKPSVILARAIHVCPSLPDDPTVHRTRETLRQYGFERVVILEQKKLRKQRENLLNQDKILDKAKGCDIALATRMVADTAADLYDYCFLFTSDADFLPAVEAVRRMGKNVWVFGYKTELAERSPYLHVPDRFIDLETGINQAWGHEPDAIIKALQILEKSRNTPQPDDSGCPTPDSA